MSRVTRIETDFRPYIKDRKKFTVDYGCCQYITINDLLFDDLCSLGYRYHHRSIERGYHPVDYAYVEPYSGKFGVGFKVHYPTKCSHVRGNGFHNIDYFIFQNI